MSPRKLAVFDVDGTIANHGIFPESIVKGIHHLQSMGYVTTISTGRGYLNVSYCFVNDMYAVY